MATVDLPIPGLPARITKSVLFHPFICLSKRDIPVGIPKVESIGKVPATRIRLGIQTLASVAGIAELPAHLLRDSYLMPPAKVAVVETGESGNGNVNPLQRERSEVRIERVSYSESQRTPARSGKV